MTSFCTGLHGKMLSGYCMVENAKSDRTYCEKSVCQASNRKKTKFPKYASTWRKLYFSFDSTYELQMVKSNYKRLQSNHLKNLLLEENNNAELAELYHIFFVFQLSPWEYAINWFLCWNCKTYFETLKWWFFLNFDPPKGNFHPWL